MMILRLLRLSVLALVAISLFIYYAGPVLAGHRIQDNGEGTFTLNRRNGAPEQAHGIARFKLKKESDSAHRLTMTLNVSDLPKRSRRLYEVWLIDDDGDNVNLTAFNTDNDGDAVAKIARNIVNMTPFDRMVVTTKTKNSFNTEMGDTEVLSGRLH